MSVIGKGGKARKVPAPADLEAELQAELHPRGFEQDVRAENNRHVAILMEI